jgi:DNA-binding CsgD family transcriptional regulator
VFTRVNPTFFIQLNDKFPNLTQAEIRILALSKLGLSVKEKANMLGISPDSVRRTQQRLNKKLGMTEVQIFEEMAA